MDTIVDVFINDTKKDLNELFDRIRKIETYQAVSVERDKLLLDKMEELQKFFKKHDESEMLKYGDIEKEVGKLSKLLYITIGIGIILGYIGIDNLKLILGGN